MTPRCDHGYALLIGVGQSAYPKWSLLVTVKDMQALRAVLTDPALCGYPDDPNHIRLLHDAGATRCFWLAAQTYTDSDARAATGGPGQVQCPDRHGAGGGDRRPRQGRTTLWTTVKGFAAE